MTRAGLKRHGPALALAGLSVLVFAAHVVWYRAGAAGGEVVSGLGAALVAVGVLVVGSGLLGKEALDRATAGAMPQDRRVFPRKHDPEASAARDELWHETRRAIKFERIGVGAMVLVGTLLNGYGPSVACLLGLKG